MSTSKEQKLPFTHVFLATDHAGLEHKQAVDDYLKENGYTTTDFGAFMKNPEDDFPIFISQAARTISTNPEGHAGIIFGGSGQGEAMMANRFPEVRAAVYYGGDTEVVRLAREHNNANVLAIGARFVSIEDSIKAVSLWLSTAPLPDKKYARRNQQIEQIAAQIPRG